MNRKSRSAKWPVRGVSTEAPLFENHGSYGDAPPGIRQSLTERGLDAGGATAVVHHLERADLEARKEAGRKNMLFGALWCFGGIAVSALSYQAAANSGGGRSVFAWGAILFGGIQFVRGLIQSAGE